MQIRIVRVRMAHRGVTVPVRMWLRRWAIMRVLVMIVMDMAMVVG